MHIETGIVFYIFYKLKFNLFPLYVKTKRFSRRLKPKKKKKTTIFIQRENGISEFIA